MKKLLSKFSYPANLWIHKQERSFLTFVVFAFMLAMFATPHPQIGMWVGFIFAAYAAVAKEVRRINVVETGILNLVSINKNIGAAICKK